jgi:hypothetical protein
MKLPSEGNDMEFIVGKEYTCRDGRKAILVADLRQFNTPECTRPLIFCHSCGIILAHSASGVCQNMNYYDIIPEKVEGWINVGRVYKTQEDAEEWAFRNPGSNRKACIKISYTLGEGL